MSTLKWILLLALFVIPADFSWSQRAATRIEPIHPAGTGTWNRGWSGWNSNNYFYPIYDAGPNIEFYSLDDEEEDTDPCFPFACESQMSEAIRNPDPTDREPQNLTACIYGVDNTLVYEREGKHCPYKFEDPNLARVERRRQEWLKNKGNLGR